MNIEYVPSIDSTNSELMRRATSGDYSTVCLVAKEQTAGRGRLGRAWLSDQDSLTFSLGLPLAPLDWSGLSLVVGLSIAKALHPRIQIKWPNDLWVNGQKLAGILIETATIQGANSSQSYASQRYAVIGVGINLATPKHAIEQAKLENKPSPLGLQELIPSITREVALERILKSLLDDITSFEQSGYKPYAMDFSKRDALLGLSIVLSSGVAGKYLGVNEQGALRLQTHSGIQTIISHEVSVCL